MSQTSERWQNLRRSTIRLLVLQAAELTPLTRKAAGAETEEVGEAAEGSLAAADSFNQYAQN